MKAIKFIFMLLLFVFLPSVYTNMHAQDPPTVAPHIYKRIALENDVVRVMEVEIAPGDTVPWHKHPDHVIYAITGGKIEITDKGKEAVTIEIKAGEVLFIPAVIHMAKNTGTETVKLIVTEIKGSHKKIKK